MSISTNTPARVVQQHSRPAFKNTAVVVKATHDAANVVSKSSLPASNSLKFLRCAGDSLKNYVKMVFFGSAPTKTYTVRILGYNTNSEGNLTSYMIGVFSVVVSATSVAVNGGTNYVVESITKLAGDGKIDDSAGSTYGTNAKLGLDLWNAEFISINAVHASDTGTLLVQYAGAEGEGWSDER